MKRILVFFLLLSFDCFAGIHDYLSYGKVYHLKENNQFAISQSLQEMNYQNMAKNGDAYANYYLGLIAQSKARFKDAFSYFKTACEKNEARACNNAGFIKHHNLEKLKNQEFEKAIYFYNKARDLNDNYAFYNLARYHFKEKDFLRSYLYYDMAFYKFKNRATQQILLNNKNGVKRKLDKLENQYLETFYPIELQAFADDKITEGKVVSSMVPLPPRDGKILDNLVFMKFKNKDKKKLRMMEWVPEKYDAIDIPEAIIFPAASDNSSINSLMYRYNSSAEIKTTLVEKKTVIPLLVQDSLTVFIYSGVDKEVDFEWLMSSVSPMMSTQTNDRPIVKNGWEEFKFVPQVKGKIFVTFNNKKTNDVLELVLLVQ